MVTLVGLLQGFYLQPVFIGAFRYLYGGQEHPSFSRSVIATLFACLCAGVVLAGPALLMKLVLQQNETGDYENYLLFVVSGFIAYRIYRLLSGLKRKADGGRN